jgi:hypothetical protein
MAEYWFTSWQYLLGTGQSAPMRQISEPNCEACKTFANEGDSILRQGGSITLVHAATLLSARVGGLSSKQATVELLYIDSQSRVRIPSQHLDQIGDPPVRAHRKVTLDWSGERWMVSHVFDA